MQYPIIRRLPLKDPYLKALINGELLEYDVCDNSPEDTFMAKDRFEYLGRGKIYSTRYNKIDNVDDCYKYFWKRKA